MRGLRVGPAPGYPVIILPWLKDKTVNEMIQHHLAEVECSQPISKVILCQAFGPFEILDLISEEEISSKFLAVFVKQPHARSLLQQGQYIAEPYTFKLSQLDKPACIVRKSYRNTLVNEMENWKKQ